MAVDIARLDVMRAGSGAAIADVDEIMAVLEEEYIPELIEAFANSPEGQAILAAQPKDEQYLGDWAGNLIFFGYAYLDVTLPSMTAQDVEEIVLGLFPRKVTLLDPDDAEAIVPELIAFWKFLQREYKLHRSKKILAFLKKSHERVKRAMNNPQNFGIAKSFMMAGTEAGFDMTTQEGASAFQEQYNQQIRETGAPPANLPGMQAMPKPGEPLSLENLSDDVPLEFVALLSQQMGLPLPPGLENLPTDPEALAEGIARHLVDSGAVTLGEDDASKVEMRQDLLDLRASLSVLDDDLDDLPELPPKAIAQLQQQQITEEEPGSILQDFQMLLEVLKEKSLPVSKKLNHWSGKTLVDLNQRLTQPIQIDLKRPQQKSFPNLHGLYMLLRATAIAEIAYKGKTPYLSLNPKILASWEHLNPTEKYMTLLEAWIIRAHEGHLGGEARLFNAGTQIIRGWQVSMARRTTFKNYQDQQSLNYWPGLYNVALLQMFGWIKVESKMPESGKGWRIKKIAPLPLGNAMIVAVTRAHFAADFVWPSESNASEPWGELQPHLGEYFPEWQENLAAPEAPAHQVGTYLFKVSLGGAWRRLAISSELTLEDLGDLIRDSVDFDSDHLDMFVYRDVSGRLLQVTHPWCDSASGRHTNEVVIGDLPLNPGQAMTYVFDFGDNWEFTALLEDIQAGKPKRNSSKVLESHGEAPEQYPSWEDE